MILLRETLPKIYIYVFVLLLCFFFQESNCSFALSPGENYLNANMVKQWQDAARLITGRREDHVEKHDFWISN